MTHDMSHLCVTWLIVYARHDQQIWIFVIHDLHKSVVGVSFVCKQVSFVTNTGLFCHKYLMSKPCDPHHYARHDQTMIWAPEHGGIHNMHELICDMPLSLSHTHTHTHTHTPAFCVKRETYICEHGGMHEIFCNVTLAHTHTQTHTYTHTCICVKRETYIWALEHGSIHDLHEFICDMTLSLSHTHIHTPAFCVNRETYIWAPEHSSVHDMHELICDVIIHMWHVPFIHVPFMWSSICDMSHSGTAACMTCMSWMGHVTYGWSHEWDMWMITSQISAWPHHK